MYDIPRIILYLLSHLLILILSFIPLIRYIALYLLAKINNYLLGFNKTIVKDYRKFKHDAEILVFQHNSYYDLYALTQFFGAKNMTGIFDSTMLEVPIINVILKNLGVIVIDKKQKNNSQKLIDYINNSNNKKYIAIAPAGGKGSIEDKIGSFKTGAFIPMKPVTPVLIRYKDDKGTWFIKYGVKDCFLDFFRLRWFYTCEMIILEEITADGCRTPREYADKVEIYMKSYNNND